jgi:hypothetical protein
LGNVGNTHETMVSFYNNSRFFSKHTVYYFIAVPSLVRKQGNIKQYRHWYIIIVFFVFYCI